jgi:uncharacterized protein (DUF362 family)/Pyruvate/2-oxoacid:ferredoxin oxidoreductase delta subunit
MRESVNLVNCPDYASVSEALSRLMEGLGGMERFVKPGQSVLIKPNLLSDHTPEDAVTTHPEVVRALIRLVKSAGATPWVADSPAMIADLRRVWERTGMEAVCREENVPLVNLEKAGSKSFEENGIRFTIATPVLEADAIITVPKVKTHVLTGLTGAMKNLYGTVPGLQKTSFHKMYPYPQDFAKLLVAIFRHVKPVLAVADGVVGMEGNGPSAGIPIHLGFLAASADAVALDVVLCRTLGLEPRNVIHLELARQAGLGLQDWSQIDVGGDIAIRALAPREHRLPATVPIQYVPRWLIRLVEPYIWHRPRFLLNCVFCGKCVKACPAEALTISPGHQPVLNSKKCIACCCCHEMCPVHAIEMQPSPFFRFARKFTAGRKQQAVGREQ